MTWIARTPALADVLAPDELRRLRLIDPAAPHAFRDATAWVMAIYEAHRPSARAAPRVGAEWIPAAFTGLAAALDDLPPPSADPLADAPGFASRVAAALARGRELRAPALVEARRLLDRLKE